MMSGGRAEAAVWQPVADWIAGLPAFLHRNKAPDKVETQDQEPRDKTP